MKRKHYTALILLLSLLCTTVFTGCVHVETTDAPPTSEPVATPTEQTSMASTYAGRPIGIFEEDGKYYLNLDLSKYKTKHSEASDMNWNYVESCLYYSSMDELWEKWRTCAFTEEELQVLADNLPASGYIQIMNPNDLFFPSNENGFWKDAEVVWNVLLNNIFFMLPDTAVLRIWYADQYETIQDSTVYISENQYVHKAELEQFADPSVFEDAETVTVGKQEFVSGTIKNMNHKHCEVEAHGSKYYVCLTKPGGFTLFTMHNGYYISAFNMVLESHMPYDTMYDTIFDPMIKSEFVHYDINE